jgi:tetratricopeptide (TPR) repeat protein
MKKKMSLLMVLMFLIAQSVISQNTNIEKQVLSKYSNTDYKISFQYPQNWIEMSPDEVTEKTQGVMSVDNAIVFLVNERDFDRNINIRVFENPLNSLSKSDINELILELDQEYPKQFNDFKKVSSKVSTISGVNALEYLMDNTRINMVLRQKCIIVVKNKLSYFITFTSPKVDFERSNRTCFEIILSTLELQSDNSTSNIVSHFIPEELNVKITKGNWQEVKLFVDSLLLEKPNSGYALYLRDIANSILQIDYKKGEGLSSYDFPYSNKAYIEKLLSWSDENISRYPENVNHGILNAMLYHKGMANSLHAMSILESLLEFDPDNIFILNSLAAGYGLHGKISKAKSLLDKAIKIDPNSSDIYNNFGMIEMSEKDYHEAEKMFVKATESKGVHAMTWFNLGSLYNFLNKKEKARICLEKAIALSPNLIEARYNLAGVYYSLGMTSKSLKQLKRIVEIAPDSEIGIQSRHNIKQLE